MSTPRPTRILGIDPGTKSHGYAILECTGRRCSWVEAGEIEATYVAAVNLMLRAELAILIIEQPVSIGVAGVAANGPLLMTAWQGGALTYLARSFGMHVKEVYAREWRRALTGSVSPSDATIKAALSRTLLGGIPERSNMHERDAAGVAWFGSRLPANWMDMRARSVEAKSKRTGMKSANTRRARST